MGISIAIINKNKSPVIRDDEKILTSEYETIIFNYKFNHGFKTYFEHIRLVSWLLIYNRKYNFIYTRYIDKQAFIGLLFARIFRKKIIVVPAGNDVARIPELKFGILRNRLNRVIVRFICRYASYVIPVSKFTYHSLQENLKIKLGSNIIVIPNEVDIEFFKFDDIRLPRKNWVITIAGCNSIERFKLKGLDTFIELSKDFKNYEFKIIGVNSNLISSIRDIPENVELIPWQQPANLRDYLISAKYICCLSVFEAFGRAFAEGMACGCIPITFADIGPAELVKDSGIIVPSRDIKTIVEYFEKATNLSDTSSLRARDIIVNNYSFNIRKSNLKLLIES